ncbi:MAG: phenylalanine--tRNA ligase subunit alpha [Candidatus Aenigmatarchaeota archaeon]
MEEKYRLTKEGREYLKKGLPEKRLVDILKEKLDKKISIKEASKLIKNFSIALKWALEKRWIKKINEEIELINYPEKILEQEALEKIALGEEVSENILKVLMERKLIEKISEEYEKLKEEVVGKEITDLTPELIRTGLWRKVKFKPYDVKALGRKIYFGKVHPYREVIDEIREKLIGLGFEEVKGPLVELNFWNCDALFMPSDHPARGIHDIFTLKIPRVGKILDKELWKRVEETHKNGWVTQSKGWGNWSFSLAKKLILRSQGTALSARILYKLKKEDLPYKMFTIDRVFRPDVIDAKHFIEFEQCEGIVVGEGLNLRHLLGYLKEIALAAGAEKVRFKPSYFPFTEGSTELQIYMKDFGWLEMGGAGIFRPEVTLPLGIDVPVLAWGLGIGRLAMIKLKVNDIRYLYTDDLQWLRKKELVR